MTLAPIALFVYDRPWHAKETIEALQKNAGAAASDLIIFSDGVKNGASDQGVAEVRALIKNISGFHSVRIIEREENIGLAKSIITGVTDVVNQYGRVIVLEDDMVTSPVFLKYMNDSLSLYANDERVISIHAYSFPIDNLPETFFIKGASCWGWATWERGWNLFESDGAKLLKEMKEAVLLDRFDIFGTYPYTKMLKMQIRGRNDSWAVRWYASALLADKLTLHPGESLLMNIGLDGSGTHCGSFEGFDSNISNIAVQVGGCDVEESTEVLAAWQKFFKMRHKPLVLRLISKCWRLIKKVVH